MTPFKYLLTAALNKLIPQGYKELQAQKAAEAAKKDFHVETYKLYRVPMTIRADSAEEAERLGTEALAAGVYANGLPIPRPEFVNNVPTVHACEVK